MTVEMDAVRGALEEWFTSHPEFKHNGWTLRDEEAANGHYINWQTVVEPPAGAPSFQIQIHLSYTTICEINRPRIDVWYFRGRLWPDGVAKDHAKSVQRVVRWVDSFANKRVKFTGSGKWCRRHKVFAAGKYGWHQLRRFGSRNWYDRLLAEPPRCGGAPRID